MVVEFRVSADLFRIEFSITHYSGRRPKTLQNLSRKEKPLLLRKPINAKISDGNHRLCLSLNSTSSLWNCTLTTEGFQQHAIHRTHVLL